MAYEFALKGKRYQAPTFAELSAIYSGLRDAAGLGASRFPTPAIREVGFPMPGYRFSYNGRIWRNQPWTPDATPIYDNRAAA